MGVTGGGEVLIIPHNKGCFNSYSHGAGWGGQGADLHKGIGASRKTATTAQSSPTPTFLTVVFD